MDESRSGTLIIALKTKEGDVVFASDMLAVLDNIKVKEQKIENKKGILIGGSGKLSCFQVWANKVEEIADELKSEESINEIRKRLREEYVKVKNDYLESIGDEENQLGSWVVESLVVFKHNDLRILRINNDGSDEEYTEFMAIGSGTEIAYGLGAFLLKETPKLEKALEIAYLIIKNVEEKDAYVGYGVDMWVYKRDGEIKHLTQTEIEKIKNESEKLERRILNAIYGKEESFEIREEKNEKEKQVYKNKLRVS